MNLRPTAERHDTARPQGAYTPMPTNRAFEWRPCRLHPWLGVSILSGRGFDPACYLEDGSAHAVDPAELERAA